MKRPLLLCTDLDRTLIPNGDAPESPRARPLVRRLAVREGVVLAYVSGRDAERIAAACAEFDLPVPDHVVADVGSSIYDTDGRRWEPWDAHIAAGWRGRTGPELDRLIGRPPGMVLQDESRQGRFKLSYEVDPEGDPGVLAAGISTGLCDAGLDVSVIVSRDDISGMGLIDVLPAAAGKAAAIEFLRGHLDIGRDDTICAGDSGNDLDMLTGPLPAVLVANASAEVRELARQGASAAGHTARLHCATGLDPDLNGNYAAGVIEGVLHFRPDLADILVEGET